MSGENWSWADYEKQFGPHGAVAPSAASAREPTVPVKGGHFIVPVSGNSEARGSTSPFAYQVVLPGALAERLQPYADRRGMPLEQLVCDLLEIEVEGGLIDITLDGDEATEGVRIDPPEAAVDESGFSSGAG